jgi:hypothetical protein
MDCDFWQGINHKMASFGEEFSILRAGTDIRSGATAYETRLLKPLHRGFMLEFIRDFCLFLSTNWRSRLPKIQKRNVLFVKALREQAGVKAIVDSSKIAIRLKYLLRNPALDIKVVWLVRDGRGVALAYKNPSQFADASDPALRGGGLGKTQEQAREVEKGGAEWVRCIEEAQAVLQTVPASNQIKVHYEDICNNTLATLKKITEFVGVDPNAIRLDFKSVEHHVVGHGLRLD